nr:hypothetical protein Iba_chr04dCG2720 [Ipomoea batatas]
MRCDRRNVRVPSVDADSSGYLRPVQCSAHSARSSRVYEIYLVDCSEVVDLCDLPEYVASRSVDVVKFVPRISDLCENFEVEYLGYMVQIYTELGLIVALHQHVSAFVVGVAGNLQYSE